MAVVNIEGGGSVTVHEDYNTVMNKVNTAEQHELLEFTRRATMGGNEPFSVRCDKIISVEYR